jgi:hypothetical protein
VRFRVRLEHLNTWNTSCTLFDRMSRKNQICVLNICAGEMPPTRVPVCPTRERLSQAFSRLENIQLIRDYLHDPLFEQFAETRIIWGELLELELQAENEQIERIAATAGKRSDS